MNVESAEVELAYTYAWWLTGDDRAARTAVLAAVDRPDVPGADQALRLEILLRRVRAAAVTTPTMCPASELALLHDAIGLGLDSAAGLAMIDAREARTELAHGRLEALGPDADFEVTEPHRLGGLAVGNPADVAAARQNDKLGQLRRAILQGRDELVGVSRIDVPAALLDEVAARRRAQADDGPVSSTPLEPEWFADLRDAGADDPPPAIDADAPTGADGGAAVTDGEVTDTPATDAPSTDAPSTGGPPTGAGAPAGDAAGPDDGVAAASALDAAEEIDLTTAAAGRTDRTVASPGRRSRAWAWGALALVAVVGMTVLLVTQSDGAPDVDDRPPPTAEVADGDVAPTTSAAPTAGPVPTGSAEPTTAPTTDPSTDPSTDPGPTPGADPTATGDPADPGADPFVLQGTGVAVGIGGEPSSDNPVADPFAPVSISVEYDGAQEGDALLVDWTVDGQPFDTERADLSPLLSTTRFTKQVPQEGWPLGQHVLSLTLERTGEVVGEARFQVAPS